MKENVCSLTLVFPFGHSRSMFQQGNITNRSIISSTSVLECRVPGTPVQPGILHILWFHWSSVAQASILCMYHLAFLLVQLLYGSHRESFWLKLILDGICQGVSGLTVFCTKTNNTVTLSLVNLLKDFLVGGFWSRYGKEFCLERCSLFNYSWKV